MTRRELFATAYGDRVEIHEIVPGSLRRVTKTVPLEQAAASPELVDTLHTVRAFLLSRDIGLPRDHWILDLIAEALNHARVKP